MWKPYGGAAMVFSGDGAQVAGANRSGWIGVWQAKTGNVTFGPSSVNGFPWQLAFSADGRRLMLGNTGTSPICWDVLTGGPGLRLPSGATTYACDFSPDGKLVATGTTYTNKLWLWDAKTGDKLHEFPIFGKSTTRIAFAREGRWLAAAANSPDIPVYDVATRKLAHTLKGHTGNVIWVAAGQRGDLLASGTDASPGREAEIKVWNLTTGKEIAQPKKHDIDKITYLALSADGDKMLVCAYGRVVVFETRTGRELLTIREKALFLPRAVFGHDGRTIFAISSTSPLQERSSDTGKVLRGSR